MSKDRYYPNYDALVDHDKNDQPLGKDPRTVPISELEKAEHTAKPLAKVIREKCLDCTVFQKGEVRRCHITNCPLWPYRMGVNPFTSAKLKASKDKEEQQ